VRKNKSQNTPKQGGDEKNKYAIPMNAFKVKVFYSNNLKNVYLSRSTA
jgi:hypothetical protein